MKLVDILFKADRVRREKLRRKREEEEAATSNQNSTSRIVEVTDEEAERITRENALTKVGHCRTSTNKSNDRCVQAQKIDSNENKTTGKNNDDMKTTDDQTETSEDKVRRICSIARDMITTSACSIIIETRR
jgi:hypothetical protein